MGWVSLPKAGKEEQGSDALVLYGLLLPSQKRERSCETEAPAGTAPDAPRASLQTPTPQSCPKTSWQVRSHHPSAPAPQHRALQGNGTRDRSRRRENTLHTGRQSLNPGTDPQTGRQREGAGGGKRRAGGSRSPYLREVMAPHGSAPTAALPPHPAGGEPRERGNPSQ